MRSSSSSFWVMTCTRVCITDRHVHSGACAPERRSPSDATALGGVSRPSHELRAFDSCREQTQKTCHDGQDRPSDLQGRVTQNRREVAGSVQHSALRVRSIDDSGLKTHPAALCAFARACGITYVLTREKPRAAHSVEPAERVVFASMHGSLAAPLTVRTSDRGWGPQSASVASRVLVRTLEDRLREERRRAFVGREREIEIFLAAIGGSAPALLFWSGDAGVGKSMLLREFQRIGEVEGARVACLDTAQVRNASPLARRAVERRLRAELASGARDAGNRPVLLIDDYETLGAEQSWLLERLFPALPSRTLIVAASRRPPPIELALDAGWAAITQEERILPFGEPDAREFLERHAVPSDARSAVLELSAGHPLALSLAAGALRDSPLTEYRAYDIQRRILDALSLEPRSRAERLALGLGAVARTVTLELLEYVLATLGDASSEDPQRLFAWLREHSLVEPRSSGLWLHPLARRGLLSRLKRERRLEFEALHLAVREFYVEKLALGVDGARWLKDLVHTQTASLAERLLGTTDDDLAALEPARSGDHAGVVELVRELDSEESARMAENWLETHPHTFELVRRERVDSVLQALVLDSRTVESLPSSDPASAVVREFLKQNPLGPDEQAVFFRFRLDRSALEAPGQRLTPVLAREIQLILSAARTVYTFSVYREFGDWKAMLERAGVPFRRCGRFTTSAGTHTVVAYSWRERPLRELLLSAGRDGAEVRRARPPELGSSTSGSNDELQLKVRKRVAELGQRSRLTTRELEILELLCLGKSAAEIARALGIRPRTVKFHQENILKKTGIASRLELFKVLL